MDGKQEEMQFLGFFGIFKESYKLIFAWRKIFSKITLALILPLYFIYLVHVEVSSLFFGKINHNKMELDHTRSGTAQERAYFWLFNAAYFTLLLIFSLLSTAAVVYTIACIYTAQELTFKNVMSAVPKVWKRLIVTFLSIFVAIFFYHFVAIVFFLIWAISLGPMHSTGVAVLVILIILYIVGFFYLTTIWHLASVVTVLEESYGFPAMAKSKNLIKGKLWMTMAIFLTINLTIGINQIAFQRLVMQGTTVGMANRVAYAIICVLLLSTMILFGLVIQTVLYFVCKSYHHENIDKSALSDHLEVFLLKEYVPLKAKDVQVEQYQV